MSRAALVALLTLLSATPTAFAAQASPSPAPAVSASSFEGSWVGALAAGPVTVHLVLHVARQPDGRWAGTLDSPDQGKTGLRLDVVSLEGDRVTATSEQLHGGFTGRLVGDRLEGTWQQGVFSAPMTFTRGSAPVSRRPQEPQPPFPYRVEDVTYPNARDGVTLAGTLTVPEGKGPFPAVVLISGSGQQDRDETILAHKPFKLWADALTRRGFAVLRVADRGNDGSTGDFAKATSTDFVHDVEAGLAFLKSRPQIDPKRLGLMGHSEGGLIAPMVAAETPDVAFLVLLAGPGLPGDRIIEGQVAALSRAAGVPADKVEEAVAFEHRILAIAKGPTPEAEARRQLEALMLPVQVDAATRAKVQAQIDALLSPWYRQFLRLDPRPYLAKVKVPVLALNGELDLQVNAQDNLAAIRQALASHGNRRVTTVALPRLNHLFQTAKTGQVQEYVEIEETVAPEVLTLVGDWLVKQAGR